MVATSSLARSALQGFVWQMEDDGTIRQTLADMQLGGTPIFAEAVSEHNSKILNVAA